MFKMKKTIFAMALIAFFVASCSKDSDDDIVSEATPSELIVGTWSGDEFSFTVTITGGPLDTTYSATQSFAYARVSFNSDGTGQFDSLGLDPEALTWKLLNDNAFILDGDTFAISLLNSTNFNLTQSTTEDLGVSGVATQETTIKLVK
jgi:PBP1b-binding outer membrane lipoprotein LpoB